MREMFDKVYPYLRKTGNLIVTNIAYILWFIFYLFISYWFLTELEIPEDTAFIICVVVYAVSVFIAFTFGETILKFIKSVRPVETKREKEYILPLFDEVYEKAKSVYPELPEIKPYIVDSMSVNLFAVGSHTVAITKGALQVFSEEELQGMILHEFAHIKNGNTKAELLNKIGNGFIAVVVIIINALFMIFDIFFRDLGDEDLKHTSGLFRALFFFIRFSVNTFMFVLLFVGNVILSGNSRKNEFTADKFAYDLGYGESLKNALYLVQKISLSSKTNLIEKMQQKHPRVSKRIEKLEEMEDSDIHTNPYPLN